MFANRPRWIFITLPFLLAAGCSLIRGGGNTIRIESEPTGADVFVMGEKVGATPVAIIPRSLFPLSYPKENESLYGKVILRKTGCSDLTEIVTTDEMRVGLLRVQLDCGTGTSPPSGQSRAAPGPSAAASAPSAAAPGPSQAAPEPSPASPNAGTVEQRLMRIKDLLSKGLITEEEARKARERILKDL